MNSSIHTPFYIFFLNPDYVAARLLRSLRSNNFYRVNTYAVITDTPLYFWKYKI